MEEKGISLEEAKGFVGVGWHPLLEYIYEFLSRQGRKVIVTQVKEKWGGLRVYVSNADKGVLDYIEVVEGVSYYLCENCGKAGKLRTNGWYKTACDECNKER